jgi:biopolymer transport protein ExbD
MSSLKARRMARNHKRLQKPARLNLVALMDIFTILVLFLMVNNGDVEVLQSDKNIILPESVSEQRPEQTVIIKISPDAILVQGRAIDSLTDALASEGNVLEPLQQELAHHAGRAGPLAEEDQARGRSVVIMGDSSMPYSLLQRVMATCADSDYRDISLAVNSVSEAEPALAAVAQEG